MQIRLHVHFQVFIACSSWNYYFEAILRYEAKLTFLVQISSNDQFQVITAGGS